MATAYTNHPTKQKIWLQNKPDRGREGHLYYCSLCDELLLLTPREINPNKIVLVFNNCPGCGFELKDNLRRDSFMTEGETVYANARCPDPEIFLAETDPRLPPKIRGSSLFSLKSQAITTGLDTFEDAYSFRTGQLVSLTGRGANSLCFLLCARAILHAPEGLDGDVIFIDIGNMFDPYAIQHYATFFGLNPANLHQRIHLSRAFTHHQGDSLIKSLSHDLSRYRAKLSVVSDITQLYCDPDVNESEESLKLFRRDVLFLRELAEQTGTLVLTTVLQQRNPSMENYLLQTSHVSTIVNEPPKLGERTAYRQSTLGISEPGKSMG